MFKRQEMANRPREDKRLSVAILAVMRSGVKLLIGRPPIWRHGIPDHRSLNTHFDVKFVREAVRNDWQVPSQTRIDAKFMLRLSVRAHGGRRRVTRWSR